MASPGTVVHFCLIRDEVPLRTEMLAAVLLDIAQTAASRRRRAPPPRRPAPPPAAVPTAAPMRAFTHRSM